MLRTGRRQLDDAFRRVGLASRVSAVVIRAHNNIPDKVERLSLPTGLLYPHQADGVAFLISKGRAILGDDMGLGKTRQAIAAMQVAAPEGAILVVCPASLKLNWRREIRVADPSPRIEVIGASVPPDDSPRWVIVN